MILNDSMIDWWLNHKPLSVNELETISKHRQGDKETTSSSKFDKIKEEYIKRLPNSGLDIFWDFKVSDCATDFIKQLFHEYVDDDTLVVTTLNEHDNVKAELKKCKNVYYLDAKEDNSIILNQYAFKDKIKHFKKVFVYIIGLHITTGLHTPQRLLKTIKELLKDKESVFVLDAVQEMFIIPRDYTMFDYIIGTAHALVKEFDMGMCWSKKKNKFGYYVENWAKQYLDNLDIILNRLDKLFLFKTVMQDELYETLIKIPDMSIIGTSAPHFFSTQINKFSATEDLYTLLKKYYFRLEGVGTSHQYLRLRGQQFITHPHYLKESLNIFYDYFDMVMENE